MRIRSFAPGKVILFGEHYVVYGAPGLVAAIGPDNEMEMEGVKVAAGAGGFEYQSTIKENNVALDCPVPPAAAAGPGAPGADPSFAAGRPHPYAALYLEHARRCPALQKLRIRARVKKAWPLKGVGNSASLGACLGAGLRELGGEKSSHALIFEDAQAADEVAHGGRPSGIDAAAASYGGVLQFEKDFATPLKPKISQLKMAPMRGVQFLLIDTLEMGEERAGTGGLVARFARAHGISRKPGEIKGGERQSVIDAYLPLFLHARRALEEGDWKVAGLLMDENHKMLAEKGVSCPRIEKAVALCKSFGALGAKLSGAGGPGGVVVAPVEKEKNAGVSEALAVEGFGRYSFEVEKKGAYARRE